MADITATFVLSGDDLPGDARATRYEAVEAVSEPYRVLVEFTTEDLFFDVRTLLRKRLSLTVIDGRGGSRWFDGIVDRAELVAFKETHLHFVARLRPALTALEHREDSRIFQEKTVIQVIQTIFQEAGFADKVTWRQTSEYPPREFIVQYRESSLDFVHRLLEENGLFYWFGHDQEGHRLIIADDAASFGAEDETPPTLFALSQGFVGADALQRFVRRRTLRATSVQLRDFDFEKPQVKPEGTQPGEDAWPAPIYDYPGGFIASSDGKRLAKARYSSARRDADVAEGRSHAIGLRCGVPFTVEGAGEDFLNGEYVVVRLVTRGSQKENESVACDNEFQAVPKDAPWAPERRTKRPVIRGVQTAIVTGSSKQEQALHVDKYGRIKVRFYWDRVGQEDHTSSCWIRCSQIAMGGTMILPRVGWEVSVCFLEGDPDRPLVLGRVYNAEKTPPYALPGSKTSGSLKSMSSPGGGGHNEIKMGDSGGGQGFDVHAQKDFNVTIEHDKKEQIGVDEEHFVSVNESISVKVDETTQVGGDQTIDVGSNLSTKVKGDQTISIGGNDTSNAISNFVEKITGDRTWKVGGNTMIICNGVEQTVSGDFKREVGSLHLNACIASINENVGGDLKKNVGAVTIHVALKDHAETITGAKNLTSLAAELHLTKGGIQHACESSVTQLIGGLHYHKLDGDLVVKGKMVTLLGAVGVFKGGSSDVKLGGGPITMKGTKIVTDGLLVVKMSGSMKLGPG